MWVTLKCPTFQSCFEFVQELCRNDTFVNSKWKLFKLHLLLSCNNKLTFSIYFSCIDRKNDLIGCRAYLFLLSTWHTGICNIFGALAFFIYHLVRKSPHQTLHLMPQEDRLATALSKPTQRHTHTHACGHPAHHTS